MLFDDEVGKIDAIVTECLSGPPQTRGRFRGHQSFVACPLLSLPTRCIDARAPRAELRHPDLVRSGRSVTLDPDRINRAAHRGLRSGGIRFRTMLFIYWIEPFCQADPCDDVTTTLRRQIGGVDLGFEPYPLLAAGNLT